ncbi:hypothetical protein NHQ30_004445 [Ciborinia camelliae]|nr:hypothetical protein NHQ30_004445 [Ciborinia camelliae]
MSRPSESRPRKPERKIAPAFSAPNISLPVHSRHGTSSSVYNRLMDPNYDLWSPQSYANHSQAPVPSLQAPVLSLQAPPPRPRVVNPVQQFPVLAPAVPLTNITSEEVEELRDRLFKLTSDYQRLYGVFMPNGEASLNATRWNSIDIDLPFLISVRQRVVNLRTATLEFENGGIENNRAFLVSQRTFFNSLVGVVTSAIERVTWLRREVEGPTGYAYQYRSWYYQVIGNNPQSTNTSSAQREEKEIDNTKFDKQAGNDDDGRVLVSPSLDSEDEEEEKREKRVKI